MRNQSQVYISIECLKILHIQSPCSLLYDVVAYNDIRARTSTDAPSGTSPNQKKTLHFQNSPHQAPPLHQASPSQSSSHHKPTSDTEKMPEPTLDTTAAAAAPESPPAETGPGATVPGASTTTTTKVPRKRFGGRKTVEALRAQQAEKDGKVGAETNIEETAVQSNSFPPSPYSRPRRIPRNALLRAH